ncbi:NAD(P)/FAD-dependent oxidoreductase [Teredinibacter turnerae]|uniref:NAD(P)/FAD-dependent oxidoreductase n=1 Tax=Teredinibacter turnerae TaxID=2426 RepID=UPI00041AFFB8|nr:NAD(P)/FAD-dependent oxidoreductase [Teredinibacter turnerae]
MAWDVIVIGAGAAGLMCAATAGARGRRVLVVDHANKAGKKILMSGGGRCNFTNIEIAASNYRSQNPHFCKSALSRYTQWDFIGLVGQHGVPYHEKELGQLFCDNKASDILSMLLAECDTSGVELRLNTTVCEVSKTDAGFTLLANNHKLSCESLVVATGGLSIPTMGATGFGYELAQQFGLTLTSRVPSLVPFTLSGKWLEFAKGLAGVSLTATVTTAQTAFTNQLLFTHRGLSGPAVLQASNYWELGEPISIDLLPGASFKNQMAEWHAAGNKQTLKNSLSQMLPKRFVESWLDIAGSNKPVNQYTPKEIDALHQQLHCWQLTPSGTEGYRTAEVTRGGIDTDQISSKTFEAKNVKGLYFIGEVLDVTGWLGGYNFQWAWASGWCAGGVV